MATDNSTEKKFVEKCSDFLDKLYNLQRKYYVLLVFLFPLLSPKRFSFLWNEYFINAFLKDFGVGMDKKPIQNLDYVFTILYIAIFLIVIGLFLYKKIKHNYIFSHFHQLILLGVASVYLIYRSGFFFSNPFFPLKLVDCHFFIFAYSDITFLAFIPPIIYFGSNIIEWINSYFEKQEDKPSLEEIKGFIHDSPIEKGESTLAKTVVAKLLQTKGENTAFSLGISGEWGTGKTSFLMLLEKELKEQAKEKHKNIVIIKFNPWNSTSPQAIITDFFDTFRSELGKYSAEIKHSLNDYSQKLVNTDGDVFSILKFIGNLFGEDKSIMQEQEKINEILRKINRQIFIFIDDLDRLDKNEVIEVIRLIRNSANFYNVFFIVAYDKGYVEEAIEQLSTHNKSFFLEKIFQLELHLPKEEYIKIAQYLYDELVMNLPFLAKRPEIKEIESFILNHEGLPSIIEHYRDVKRFVNSFSVVYNEDLAKETYFPDFFHIELLRFKFPLVYDLLKNHTLKLVSYLPVQYLQSSDSKYDTNIKYIKEELAKRKCYELSVNHKIMVLFSYLQHEKKVSFYTNSTYTIHSKEYINTYFAYHVFSDIISNNTFQDIMQENTFKIKIDDWCKTTKMKDEFVRKFNEFCSYSTSISDTEKEYLIKAFFYFCQKNNYNFDYISMTLKVDLISLFKFQDTERLKKFTESLFKEAPYPYKFESSILSWLNKFEDNNFILDKKEREKIIISYQKN